MVNSVACSTSAYSSNSSGMRPPGSSLAENLKIASNSSDLKGQAEGVDGLTKAPDIRADLNATASKECFGPRLAGFLTVSGDSRTDPETSASSKALLGCAIQLHLLKQLELVAPEKLALVTAELKNLADAFRSMPTQSLTTYVEGNSKGYDQLRELTKSIDGLLKSSGAKTAEIFHHASLFLCKEYIVNGTRYRAESEFGQLDANSAKALMENGSATHAATQVMEGLLQNVKERGDSQSFGDFINLTIASLELRRAGKKIAPAATGPMGQSNGSVASNLHCCNGYGSGPNITVSPSITVTGAPNTNTNTNTNTSNGSPFSTSDVKEPVRTEPGKTIDSTGSTSVTSTAGSAPPDFEPATIERKTSLESRTLVDGVMEVENVVHTSAVIQMGDIPPPLELDELPPPPPLELDELPPPPPPEEPPLAPPQQQREQLQQELRKKLKSLSAVQAGDSSRTSDGSAVRVPVMQAATAPRLSDDPGDNPPQKYFADLLATGRANAKVALRNLPDSAPPNYTANLASPVGQDGLSVADSNFYSTLKTAIQTEVGCHKLFESARNDLAAGISVKAIAEKNNAFAALIVHSRALGSKLERLQTEYERNGKAVDFNAVIPNRMNATFGTNQYLSRVSTPSAPKITTSTT